MATVLIPSGLFESVSQLQPNEQARVIQFVTQFQKDPAHPGISLERVRSAGEDLWSGRISQDLRAILYKNGDTWAILHADHHDSAYAWAERKQIGQHSVTRALQIVDVQEVEETREDLSRDAAGKGPAGIFSHHDDAYLLSLGVPEAWLPAVKEIGDEDNLFRVCELLPEDVAERLLTLATGEIVTPPLPEPDAPVERVRDTQRRFFVADSSEELRMALEAPLETWIAFLHPSQRAIVDGDFNGPVKVTGSAGTGKTVVALHRARKLARDGDRVLLTSYVTTLCDNLDRSLSLITTPEVRDRITVSTVHSLALEFVNKIHPSVRPAGGKSAQEAIGAAAVGSPYEASFVLAEWENVIQRQGIQEWSEYRSTRRVGRGKPLSARDRKALWEIFTDARERLRDRNQLTWTDLCIQARGLIESGQLESPFDAVIVDELQDLNAGDIQFLWALARDNPGKFMVAGDAGQRIYAGGFSLRSLGIEVRGRSHILRINYRTTEQIRRSADNLLGNEVDDMDSGTERRDKTRSLLSGPRPGLDGYAGWEKELKGIVDQIESWLGSGLEPEDIAIFARTNALAGGIATCLEEEDRQVLQLSRDSRLTERGIRVGSMHRAKGLEFKAVLVAAVSAKHLPNKAALYSANDPKDRTDAVERERRLLYVAMTRARDELTVTWSGEPSEFLEPLLSE